VAVFLSVTTSQMTASTGTSNTQTFGWICVG
jgi:hypothetical protein